MADERQGGDRSGDQHRTRDAARGEGNDRDDENQGGGNTGGGK